MHWSKGRALGSYKGVVQVCRAPQRLVGDISGKSLGRNA